MQFVWLFSCLPFLVATLLPGVAGQCYSRAGKRATEKWMTEKMRQQLENAGTLAISIHLIYIGLQAGLESTQFDGENFQSRLFERTLVASDSVLDWSYLHEST